MAKQKGRAVAPDPYLALGQDELRAIWRAEGFGRITLYKKETGAPFKLTWTRPKVEGKKRSQQSTTCDSFTEARRKGSEIIGSIRDGGHWFDGVGLDRQLRHLAAEWHEDLVQGTDARTPSQYKIYLRQYLDVVGGALGRAAQVEDLTWANLKLLVNWSRGRGITKNSTRNKTGAVRSFHQWVIDKYPHLDAPPVPSTPKMKVRHGEGRVEAPILTFEQIDKLFPELQPDRYITHTIAYRVALLMRYTGLRWEHCVAIRWGDVRWGEYQIGPVYGKSQLEKENPRFIPLSPHLEEELKTWKKHGSMFLVAAPTKGRHTPGGCRTKKTASREGHKLTENQRTPVNKAMRQAWIRAGVEPVFTENRIFHCIRRAWRSRMEELGCDPRALEWCEGRRQSRLFSEAELCYWNPWVASPEAIANIIRTVPRIDPEAVVPNSGVQVVSMLLRKSS